MKKIRIYILKCIKKSIEARIRSILGAKLGDGKLFMRKIAGDRKEEAAKLFVELYDCKQKIKKLSQ